MTDKETMQLHKRAWLLVIHTKGGWQPWTLDSRLPAYWLKSRAESAREEGAIGRVVRATIMYEEPTDD